MKILKVIDMWGWAYDFVNREQARYSRHEIITLPCQDVSLTERGQYDAIYIHGTDIGPDARETLPLQAKALGIPVVGGYGGYNELKYMRADAICAISPQAFAWSRRNYACRVYFITEGIDVDFWQPDPSRDFARELLAGWAGRDVPLKRTHLLPRLCRPVLVQSDRSPTDFVQDRDLSPMQRFYRRIDVLVLLSSTECMPRVVMEAMACGLPVISTAVGNVRSVLEDEWLIKEETDGGIVTRANHLLISLDDPQTRERCSAAHRAGIEEKSSWKVLAPQWDDMFEEVVSEYR